jgi:hypothetical protein
MTGQAPRARMRALAAAGTAAALVVVPAVVLAQQPPPDSAPPKVSKARLVGKKAATPEARKKGKTAPVWSIEVHAADSDTGVAYIQVAADQGHPPKFKQLPGVFRQYNDVWKVRQTAPVRWVRVGDAAFNVSPWKHIDGAARPRVTAKAKRSSLARLLRSGVTATVGCDELCNLVVTLVLDSGTAERLHINRTLARDTTSLLRAGHTSVRLHVAKTAKPKLSGEHVRRVTLIVRGRDIARLYSTKRVTVVRG